MGTAIGALVFLHTGIGGKKGKKEPEQANEEGLRIGWEEELERIMG